MKPKRKDNVSRLGLRRRLNLIEGLEARTLLSVNSFDFSRGFTGNALNLNGGAAYAGPNLQISDTTSPNQSRSAFYDTTVPISSFSTDFSFQLSSTGGNGFTFAVQNTGPSVVGSAAAGLGYGGMAQSAAVCFNWVGGVSQTGLSTNGVVATPTNLGAAGINLQSGDPFVVHLTYNGSTLSVKEVDTLTSVSATQTYSVNLPSLLGSSRGYIGFTAGTSSTGSSTVLSGWDYVDTTNTPSLGVNVDSITNYASDQLFADAMKSAAHWGSLAKPWDNTAAEDGFGWPTTDAGVVVISNPGVNINGTYALTFTGQASSIYGVACSVAVQNKVYNSSTNTTTAQVILSNSTQLMLDFSGTRRLPTDTTATGVANVRLMRPSSSGSSTSYPASAVFNTPTINLISKFSAVRYMDFTRTNTSADTNWSDRTLPSENQAGIHGGAWEYAVALANFTNTDMWINIPAAATDAYVTNLANLIRYGSDGVNPYNSPQVNPVFAPLAPGQHVYIEYSNETWDRLFPQWAQNQNAANTSVAQGNSPLNYDGTANTLTWGIRHNAERTLEVSNLFRAVFGASQMMSRIRPVVAWQYNNANATAQIQLDFLNNYYNNSDGIQHVATPHPVNYYAWGGSGGWYGWVNNSLATGSVVIANADFESPVVTTVLADPPAAGWTFTGTSGIVANGSSLGNVAAPSGTQAAYITGTGSFSQTVIFPQGLADVTFQAAQGSTGSESFDVFIDGVKVDSAVTPAYTVYKGFASLSYNCGITGGTHVISFVGRGGTGTAFIDNVISQSTNDIFNSGIGYVTRNVVVENAWSQAFGLHTVGYEGGWTLGISSPNDLQVQIYFQDPRTEGAQVNTINQFFANGGDLGMVYDTSGDNAYGLTVDPNNLTAPKLLGVNDIYAAGLPPVIQGTLLPTIAGQSVMVAEDSSNLAPSTSTQRIYVLRATAPGVYTLALNGMQLDPNDTLHFMLDGVVLPGLFSLPTTSTGGNSTPTFTFNISSSGLHALSLFNDGPNQANLGGGVITITAGSGTTLPSAPASVASASATAGSVGQVNVSWSATSGASGYKIERSTDGVYFTVVGAAASPAVTFVDSTVSPGATYYYRVQAYNAAGLGAASPVSLMVVAVTATVPTPWTDSDVNYPNVPGFASFNSATSTWTVGGTTTLPAAPGAAPGQIIPAPSDQLNFLHSWVSTSNFVLQGKITSVSDAAGWAGLMVRDSLASNGAWAGVAYSPDQGVSFVYRSTDGAADFSVGLTAISQPVWARVVRSGTSFSGYYSMDGANWIQLGLTQTISMPTTALTGIAVSSDSGFTRNFATLSNVATLPSSPTVQLTHGTGNALKVTWSAIAGATSYNLYRSNRPNGEAGSLLAGSLTSTVYNDTASSTASYYYVVTAVGPQGESLPSNEVTNGLPFSAANRLVVTTPPQGGQVGGSIGTVVVTVQDSLGNTVLTDNSSVMLTLIGGTFSTTFNNVSAPVANGVAVFSNLGISASGTYTLIATDGTLAKATSPAFTVTAATNAPAKLTFALQTHYSNVAGTDVGPVIVNVQNGTGVTVTSDTSAVTLTLSGATFANGSTSTLVSAVAGVATFTGLVINTAGRNYSLTATDGSLVSSTSALFKVVPASAALLAFTQEPGATLAGSSINPAPAVSVEDAFGNLVTTDSSAVTLTLNGGTFANGQSTVTAVASGGVATFGNLYVSVPANYTLSATDGTYTGTTSTSFPVIVANATKLAFAQQPSGAVAGLVISPAIVVNVENTNGQLVTSNTSIVTLTLTGGTFAGGLNTVSQQAVGGVATFSSLVINHAATGYTLTASDGMLSGATSSAFAVSSAPASQLSFKQQPSNGSAGVALSPAVSVTVVDAFGNLVATDSSTVTLTLSTGAFSSGQPTLTAVAAGGVAFFTNVTINSAGVSYTLTASDGLLGSSTSTPFAITSSGAAAKLAFTVQPTTSVAGVAMASAVAVAVEDSFGNVVSSNSSMVTLTLNGAVFSTGLTTASAPASAGVASFAGLIVDAAGAGYTLTASDGTFTGATSTVFSVTPSSSTKLAFTQQPVGGGAGVALAPAVTVAVQDAFGNTVTADISIVTLTLVGAMFSNGQASASMQAVGGVAAFNSLVINSAGTGYTFAASDSAPLTNATSNAFNISPAAAAKLSFVEQPTSSTAGVAMTTSVTVAVQDQFGNLIATDGSTVTLTPSVGTFAGGQTSVSATASGGVATFANLTFNTAGSANTLVASDSPLAMSSSNAFTIAANGPSMLAFTVQPSLTTAGATISPQVAVAVLDLFGNVVTNDASIISLTLNVGTFANGLATVTASVAAGVATFPTLAINSVSTGYTLTASDAELQTTAMSNAFAIVAAGTVAAKLGFGQQPVQAVAGVPLSPAVTVNVCDSLGNLVTSDTSIVTLTLTGATLAGGATTITTQASNGVATFNALVINAAGSGYSLTATDAALTSAVSSTFAVVAATPTKLVFGQSPTSVSAGVAVNPSVTVLVQDVFGNNVTSDQSTVTLALNGGNFAVGGNTVAAVASGGVATFNNLMIDSAGSTYSLTATDSLLTSSTSTVFAITPAAPAKLGLMQSPPSVVVAGVALSPTVAVDVQDAFGNIVTSNLSTVTLTLSGGSFAGGGTTATASTVNGIATFSGLAIDAAGTSYILTATDGTLISTSTAAFTVSPAAPSKVVFSHAPGSAAAGSAISPSVVVFIQDAFGNTVLSDQSSVTVTLAGGSFAGGASNATAQAVNGVATFSTLVINTPGASYSLTASDGVLSSATSSVFSITAASAAKLALIQSPPTSVKAGAAISPAIVIGVRDAIGNLVTSNTTTVMLTLSGGVFANGSSTASVAAVNGLATFANLVINTAGTGYSLSATDGSLAGTATSTFAVVPATAAKLVFIQPPTSANAAATISPAVAVAVEDAFGNIATADGSTVTLALAGGTFSNGLSTVSAVAVKGVATFANLSISMPGASYSLKASDGTLATSTSATFAIVRTSVASQAVLTRQPSVATAGVAFAPAITVAVEDSLGNVSVNDASTVTLTLTGGKFANGSSTATAVAIKGVATFASLVVNVAGTYTLTATDGSLASTTSLPIRVNAAPVSASHSVITVGSVSIPVHGATSVTLTARDVFGNALTSGGLAVAFTLAGTGTTVGTFGVVTDHGNGTYTALFTATSAGTARQIAANINGVAVSASLPTIMASTVSNVAAVPILALKGTLFTNAVATFTDTNPTEPAASFSAAISWGDGTTSPGTITLASGKYTIRGSHTYAIAGSFAPSIVISDQGTVVASVGSSATVSAASIAGTGIVFHGQEGRTTASIVATFLVTNTSAPLSEFSCTINYGDGSTPWPGTISSDGNGNFHITASHAYRNESTGSGYPMTITIKDTNGSSVIVSTTATIVEAVLTALTVSPITVAVNSPLTNKIVGSFQDADAMQTSTSNYSATIVWGDGSQSAGAIQFSSSQAQVASDWNILGTHSYTQKGTYTVTLTVVETGTTNRLTLKAVVMVV